MFLAALGLVKLISEQEECTLTPHLTVFICHNASTGFDFGKPSQGWWWRGCGLRQKKAEAKIEAFTHFCCMGGW